MRVCVRCARVHLTAVDMSFTQLGELTTSFEVSVVRHVPQGLCLHVIDCPPQLQFVFVVQHIPTQYVISHSLLLHRLRFY